jgi:hypothetical protein
MRLTIPHGADRRVNDGWWRIEIGFPHLQMDDVQPGFALDSLGAF